MYTQLPTGTYSKKNQIIRRVVDTVTWNVDVFYKMYAYICFISFTMIMVSTKQMKTVCTYDVFYTIINYFFMDQIDHTNGQIKCEDPPIGCPRDKIKYYLYTAYVLRIEDSRIRIFWNFQYLYLLRVDQPPHELAVTEPDTIKNATIVPNADFKFVLHGFMQWKNCPMWLELREGVFHWISPIFVTYLHQYYNINISKCRILQTKTMEYNFHRLFSFGKRWMLLRQHIS